MRGAPAGGFERRDDTRQCFRPVEGVPGAGVLRRGGYPPCSTDVLRSTNVRRLKEAEGRVKGAGMRINVVDEERNTLGDQDFDLHGWRPVEGDIVQYEFGDPVEVAIGHKVRRTAVAKVKRLIYLRRYFTVQVYSDSVARNVEDVA